MDPIAARFWTPPAIPITRPSDDLRAELRALENELPTIEQRAKAERALLRAGRDVEDFAGAQDALAAAKARILELKREIDAIDEDFAFVAALDEHARLLPIYDELATKLTQAYKVHQDDATYSPFEMTYRGAASLADQRGGGVAGKRLEGVKLYRQLQIAAQQAAVAFEPIARQVRGLEDRYPLLIARRSARTMSRMPVATAEPELHSNDPRERAFIADGQPTTEATTAALEAVDRERTRKGQKR